MTTVEAIYEDGIFKPISNTPLEFKEHEQVTLIIEKDNEQDLKAEFAQWEAASDEDFLKFEKSLGELD